MSSFSSFRYSMVQIIETMNVFCLWEWQWFWVIWLFYSYIFYDIISYLFWSCTNKLKFDTIHFYFIVDTKLLFNLTYENSARKMKQDVWIKWKQNLKTKAYYLQSIPLIRQVSFLRELFYKVQEGNTWCCRWSKILKKQWMRTTGGGGNSCHCVCACWPLFGCD